MFVWQLGVECGVLVSPSVLSALANVQDILQDQVLGMFCVAPFC